MSTQHQALVAQEFNFSPTTLTEAIEYATIFAGSGLCPDQFKGRPNDILIVWQVGRELGLDKMQSLRTLGCINGMPFAYGDGQLALVRRHPDFIDMKEWLEGTIEEGTLTAYCTMTRKNNEPVTQSFSMQDAKLAMLWNKKGVWQQYPKRMLQHRARSFAIKDAFPDAIYGLKCEYEAREIHEKRTVVDVAPQGKGMSALEAALNITNEPTIIEPEIIEEPINQPLEKEIENAI
jgi:hypothetical protein